MGCQRENFKKGLVEHFQNDRFQLADGSKYFDSMEPVESWKDGQLVIIIFAHVL
jgi:hypothetical protein